LPDAIEAMESGDPARIEALGFPPDVRAGSGKGSLYLKNLAAYWYITTFLHGMHLDPETSIAYGDVADPGPADAWNGRLGSWRFDRSPRIAERVAGFANTGRIRCNLVELAAEYDHLVTPNMNFEPYGRMVADAGRADRYRAEVLPDAHHVDAWSDDPEYPEMKSGYARVMAAFDELVRWVEG
jgi:hypothetical protein